MIYISAEIVFQLHCSGVVLLHMDVILLTLLTCCVHCIAAGHVFASFFYLSISSVSNSVFVIPRYFLDINRPSWTLVLDIS